MIREATKEDIPRLLVMCRKFFAASEYADITKLDEDAMTSTLCGVIDNEQTCLLVPDDLTGMVAGIVYPFYFSTDVCAQELFWWSEGGHGRALLEAFEAWAKSRGANAVTMICLDRLGRDRVESIYKKAGYRASEHSWIKRLSDGD